MKCFFLPETQPYESDVCVFLLINIVAFICRHEGFDLRRNITGRGIVTENSVQRYWEWKKTINHRWFRVHHKHEKLDSLVLEVSAVSERLQSEREKQVESV